MAFDSSRWATERRIRSLGLGVQVGRVMVGPVAAEALIADPARAMPLPGGGVVLVRAWPLRAAAGLPAVSWTGLVPGV